jgi:hypothetical protein
MAVDRRLPPVRLVIVVKLVAAKNEVELHAHAIAHAHYTKTAQTQAADNEFSVRRPAQTGTEARIAQSLSAAAVGVDDECMAILLARTGRGDQVCHAIVLY